MVVLISPTTSLKIPREAYSTGQMALTISDQSKNSREEEKL